MKASRLWIGFVALVLAGCSPTTNLLNPDSGERERGHWWG